jgi:4-amino-4-deoxy-L-arabinose transferase-like glycosyltransferase
MTRFFKAFPITGFLLVALLLLGAGLRLYDLTDQPLDFHATRQLRSALVARNLYYQMLPDADPETRQLAYTLSRSTGQYEPPVLETLVAWTYRLTGQETLWVSRLFTIAFWIIGGWALFDLARRMTGSGYAALVSLTYFLLLPFAVQASRSFQPDPGMVMWVILTANMLYRWSEEQSNSKQWRWAVLAGIFGGMAILTKVVAVYLVGVTALFLVIADCVRNPAGWKRFWRNPQVWVMAVLMVAPTALFYLLGRQGRAAEYVQSWTISLSHLLLDPSLYARWFNLLVELMGLAFLVLGVVGIALAAPRSRALLAGLWIGYILYGLTLPYQMTTHTYYHLQFVPILALSLAPAVEPLIEKFKGQGGQRSSEWVWKAVALLGLAAAIVYLSMTSIIAFRQENFRNDSAYWEEIGSKLPTDGRILGLTQEYGFPLAYYGWRKVTIWPILGERQLAAMRGDPKAFEDYFKKKSESMGYFLITAFNQLNQQPDLKEYLYQNYPVFAEGDGYLIFDLENP